ncbi:carbamoyltransferase C-terminal domain-containing protein [Nostoc sp.]|uniref:carbamoyltransferase C-terminal domain-containing protein n=1 Tax=Nostoc sp. TaxID=1180 RepID=UPI002FFC3A05
MDIAASIQVILNEAVLAIARYVHQQTQQENLCLAGGVALNVVAMGKLSREGSFRQLWIQPAAGDAGGALGAALWFWHQKLSNMITPIQPDAMQGAFLGTNIPPASELDDAMLERLEAVWQVHSEKTLQGLIAQKLAEGKVVPVARGRMEFGLRALGARSILGDARSPYMQSQMNLKIKFRESFRPFAPMVLAEDAAEYFEIQQESPYMLLACLSGEREQTATRSNKGSIRH